MHTPPGHHAMLPLLLPLSLALLYPFLWGVEKGGSGLGFGGQLSFTSFLTPPPPFSRYPPSTPIHPTPFHPLYFVTASIPPPFPILPAPPHPDYFPPCPPPSLLHPSPPSPGQPELRTCRCGSRCEGGQRLHLHRIP
jgi:hypothetical protein